MFFPKNLVPYELSQKLIIVVKKETNNLKRVLNDLTNTYPDLKKKKVLIIDDEADFASISFHKEKESGLIELGKIAKQIDEIRTKVDKSDFLQVTATPYSLYLQPDNDENLDGLFPPKRPAFTIILPEYKDYVGGDFYFIKGEDETSPASCVYEELPVEELEILNVSKKLKRADRRSFRIEEVFTSSNTKILKTAIINFIVGSCIRRIQQRQNGGKEENYSFVIHTDIHRVSQNWQEELVNKLNEGLVKLIQEDKNLFNQLINEAYEDLKPSIELTDMNIPEFNFVLENVTSALAGGMLVVEKVNSDKDVKALLDSKGQLRLRTPLNIFIGGQILDRGITIKNMIGFYYGRSPKKFQQDTVLQHSRMYGARSKEDLAVTRFYTTRNIYDIMRRIHEFDNALRKAFLSGSHDCGVYFIRKDASDRLVPCSPNKIMLSNITTLKPYKRLLPIGFQTGYKSNIKKNIEELDKEITSLQNDKSLNSFLISVEKAIEIIEKVEKTFVYDEKGFRWDIKSHKACLEYLSKNSSNELEKNKVWLVVNNDSNITRKRPGGRFSDVPDSETTRAIAEKVAENIPALILVRVRGEEQQQWRGSPFWWPVIMAQKNTHTAIFTSDIINRK